jgi:hypothetical protein
MASSRFFDATTYRTTEGHGETTIGITFRPTPALTQDELHQLISDLIRLGAETLGEKMDREMHS